MIPSDPEPPTLDIPGVGRVQLLMPTIREDDEPDLREAAARHRLTLTTGECPCGARLVMPNRAIRRAMKRDQSRGGAVWTVAVPHELGCPAGDPRINGVTSR